MRRRALIAALLCGTVLAGPGHAGPVVGLVGGFLNAVGFGGAALLSSSTLGGWTIGFSLGQALAGTVLGQLVLSVGLSALSNALAPRPKLPKPAQRLLNYAQPVAFMERGYGRVRKGGVIGFTGFKRSNVVNPDGGDDRPKRHYTVLIAAHSTLGPVEHWLDKRQVEVDGDGFVETAPIYYAGDDVGDEANRWHGSIRVHTGQTGQLVDDTLNAAFPEVTGGHDYEGLSYAAIYAARPREDRFQRVYPNGREWAYAPVWDMSDVVSDPRDDSTGWTDNAALIIAAEAVHFGKSVDWDEVGAQADLCDALVTNAESASQKTWTINGVFDDSMTWETVRDALALACDAWFYERIDGKVGFKVGGYEAPTVTLTDADFLSVQVVEGAWGPDVAGEFAVRYVEPSRDYVEAVCGTWIEDSGAPRIEEEAFLIDSHNQAARVAKRLGRLTRPQYSVSGTVKLIGYELIGQRFVALSLAQFGLEIVVEVERLTRAEGGMAFTLEARSVTEDDFAFDAATEEPTRPAYSDIDSEDTIDVPTGLSGVVITGTGGAALIEWSWDDQGETLRQDIRIRSFDAGINDWQVVTVPAEQNTYVASGLVDGAAYEAQLRNRTGSARLSDWEPVTPVVVTAIANSTAPGPITGFGATVTGSDVALAWTAPNVAVYFAARIYRAVGSTSFGAASLIRIEYGIPSGVDGWTDAGLAAGSYSYWVEPINSSGVAGSLNGPQTVTVP